MATKAHDDGAGGGGYFRRVAENRKARHLYQIEEKFEAGLALTGNEVKSLREGDVSIAEGYARVTDGEVFLVDCHIAPYGKTGFDTPEPGRSRRLLLKRSEIRRIAVRVNERGWTLVPLRVYFRGSWAKVEIALARGRSRFDRREQVRERSERREMDRALKGRGSRRRSRGR